MASFTLLVFSTSDGVSGAIGISVVLKGKIRLQK